METGCTRECTGSCPSMCLHGQCYSRNLSRKYLHGHRTRAGISHNQNYIKSDKACKGGAGVEVGCKPACIGNRKSMSTQFKGRALYEIQLLAKLGFHGLPELNVQFHCSSVLFESLLIQH